MSRTQSIVLGWFIGAITLTCGAVTAHDETREAADLRRQRVEAAALALADPTVAELPESETVAVELKIVDAANQQPLPALVRITNVADGLAIRLPGEIHRAENWYSLEAVTTLRLPRRKLKIEAVHGLETERAVREIDFSVTAALPLTPNPSPARGEGDRIGVTLQLRRFHDARKHNLRAGNTHLHLKELSVAEMDRYLRLVPQSDGLELVFVSYLLRPSEDRNYSSNLLTAGDLARLSESGTLYGNGEEHRHNFGRGGQGYGHVMFLNIQGLIEPVSIGPGIGGTADDGRPLRPGIDAARGQGATVIWCHNRFGLEDVPSWLAARLDAQNIHDGGQTHGSYDETYYRYLNLGLHVPFSTGTDWFVYDFSRVYVPLEGQFTAASWLKQLAAGRTTITNGPLLEFSIIDGDATHQIGDVVRIKEPKTMRVRASARGRHDFRAVELVFNGRAIHSQPTRRVDEHFEAVFDERIELLEPGWLAARIPDRDQVKNELGQPLFAHTSPIYVEIGGRRRFDRATAEQLLTELKAAPDVIRRDGVFADDAGRERVLEVYREAIATLEARLAAAPQE